MKPCQGKFRLDIKGSSARGLMVTEQTPQGWGHGPKQDKLKELLDNSADTWCDSQGCSVQGQNRISVIP